MVSMRAWIWSAVACGSGGPPQVRRSSLWMTPWVWPGRWLQAPTGPLSSLRSAARAWRLTGGAAGGACGADEIWKADGVWRADGADGADGDLGADGICGDDGVCGGDGVW